MKIIAQRVKNLREGIGVPQRKLAQEIGVTQAIYFHLKHSVGNVRLV